MRTFKLIDNDGRQYDVTTKNSLFFFGIEGLGFSHDSKFQRIEERYAVLSNVIKQGVVKGTVHFWQPGAEQAYFDFAQFCQNEPIIMEYVPDRVAYRRNGLITAIKKSDGKGKSLEIEIEFTALTPWYKIIAQHNDGSAIGGKVYDYQYDYQYTVAVQNSVSVDSDSYQSSPVKLIIYGPASNPTWRYYLNGILRTSGKVNGNVLPDHVLIIDTTTIPYSIKQFDLQGNLVSDMYQQSDFSTGRFVRFGKGRNTITVQAENTNKLILGVEAQIEYATV